MRLDYKDCSEQEKKRLQDWMLVAPLLVGDLLLLVCPHQETLDFSGHLLQKHLGLGKSALLQMVLPSDCSGLLTFECLSYRGHAAGFARKGGSDRLFGFCLCLLLGGP